MKIIRVPMTVGTPGSTYNLTVTLPAHAKCVAIGLIVDSKAALIDHQVTSIRHGGLEYVSKSTVSSTDYYPALGHVACCLANEAVDEGYQVGAKFTPWPGRYNNGNDWRSLLARLADRQELSQAEVTRLQFADAVPCENFTFIRMAAEQEFKVALSRIYGSTSILYADLVCIDFSDSPRDVEVFKSVCRQPDLTDAPHWLGQALILAAAAAVASDTQRRWTNTEIAPHALRISHLLATAYQNNSGTIAYDATYATATLLKLKSDAGGRIWPSYADARRPLATMAPQLLQLQDCWRRFDRILRWQDSLLIEAQGLVTTYQKDIRLTFYGLLRPQDKAGHVADAA